MKKIDLHSTSLVFFFLHRQWVAFLFDSAISCTHKWVTKWIANHILDIRHSFLCSSCKWRIFRCQPNQSCLCAEISIVTVHRWVTLWQTRKKVKKFFSYPKIYLLDGWFAQFIKITISFLIYPISSQLLSWWIFMNAFISTLFY